MNLKMTEKKTINPNKLSNSKRKIIYEDTSLDGVPLDYSSLDIKELNYLLTEDPRSGTKRKNEENKTSKNNLIEVQKNTEKQQLKENPISHQKTALFQEDSKKRTLTLKPINNLKSLINTYNITLKNSKDEKNTKINVAKKKKKIKLITSTLLLGYNSIRNLKKIEEILIQVMYDPIRNLRWLDLQHNYLEKLDDALASFTNLQCLYLHSNFIYDINEFKKLSLLEELKTLTVHNNPLVKLPNFRLYFIAIFPKLKKLDTVLITSKERDNSFVWIHTFKKKLYPAYNKIDCQKPPLEEVIYKNNED
jgi:hypothetical protein